MMPAYPSASSWRSIRCRRSLICRGSRSTRRCSGLRASRADAVLVEFEPLSHTYRINGCPAPGVTRVLGDQLEDFSMVDPEVLEAARVFGTHVHEAVHFWNIGELDWPSLDPLLVRPVEQWAEFIESNDITIIASEVMVAHPLHKYAGRLDTLA